MAHVFKLLYFTISVLLLLQLADAVKDKPSSKGGSESKGQDGEEHTATFLKNIGKIKKSRPVKITKKHLSNFSKDFKSKLNAESKKQVNGDNSLIPDFVKHNVILPGKAAFETSIDTLRQPVGKALSGVKKKCDNGLIKSKQMAYKPVDFLKTSKSIAGNTFGGLFGKASSISKRGK